METTRSTSDFSARIHSFPLHSNTKTPQSYGDQIRSESVPVKRQDIDIVHADSVIGSVRTAKHNREGIRRGHRLKGRSGGIPRPGHDATGTAPGRDTSRGRFERIADGEGAVVVGGIAEAVVDGDGVVAAGAGVHGLDEGEAAGAVGIAARVEVGGEGVGAAVVGAAGTGEAVGGSADFARRGPGGPAGRRRSRAGLEATVPDDGPGGAGGGTCEDGERKAGKGGEE